MGWTIEAPAGLVAMAGPGSQGRHAPSEGCPSGRQRAASRPFAAAEPYHLLRIMDNYVITHEMMIQGGQRRRAGWRDDSHNDGHTERRTDGHWVLPSDGHTERHAD